MKVTSTNSVELYHRLADCIGGDLLRRSPNQLLVQDAITSGLQDRCAVYVAIGGSGDVLYVGSVCRQEPGAVSARMREHIRDGVKAATWDRLWVLPLHPSTPTPRVREAARRVATLLRHSHGRARPARHHAAAV